MAETIVLDAPAISLNTELYSLHSQGAEAVSIKKEVALEYGLRK